MIKMKLICRIYNLQSIPELILEWIHCALSVHSLCNYSTASAQ